MTPDQVHPTAVVGMRARVENGAEVLQCAVVRDGAEIGANTRICSHVYIDKGVKIGKRCKVKNHAFLCEGVTLGDDVFIGPGAVFTNDPDPRAYAAKGPPYPRTIVRARATIGANATILPGVEIGREAMVGAGAVVLADVPEGMTVVGVWKGKVVPARTQGTDATSEPLYAPGRHYWQPSEGSQMDVVNTAAADEPVQEFRLKVTEDSGSLTDPGGEQDSVPHPEVADVRRRRAAARPRVEKMTVRGLRKALRDAGVEVPRGAKKTDLVDLYLDGVVK